LTGCAAQAAGFSYERRVSELLAEQSLTLGLSAVDQAYVLEHGRIELSGGATHHAS
jgi:ABC-type branched-subunit amino acid transport system ATPase component